MVVPGAMVGSGGEINGWVSVLAQRLTISSELSSPCPAFRASATFQCNDPYTVPGSYTISQGSELGTDTIRITLRSNDGRSLHINGELEESVSQVYQLSGRITLVG